LWTTGGLVRGLVEEALKQFLDAEVDKLCPVACYERTTGRQDTSAGRYNCRPKTKAGEVSPNAPKLRQQKFETAIIE